MQNEVLFTPLHRRVTVVHLILCHPPLQYFHRCSLIGNIVCHSRVSVCQILLPFKSQTPQCAPVVMMQCEV